MLYRPMKSTGDTLSILGYGCMRLPEKNGKIDEERATLQLRSAIDRGVNYVDTAVPYHMGASEPFLGRALGNGYRDKVKIATKMPHWFVKKPADMDTILAGQLEKLRTDRIDYYLIHNMSTESWAKLKQLGVVDFIARAKAQGRIRHIGFSFHGGREEFRQLLGDYPWEFCQIQLNYLDEENQAGVAGLEYAASKGIGVIVMEPLRGGTLGSAPSQEIREVWEGATPKRSPAEWALRWVWNRPEVTLLLSGMNDERHIDENVRIAAEAQANSLSGDEIALINRVRDLFRSRSKVPCTGCRYCMPCPAGVDIPGCFQMYNTRHLGGGGRLGGSSIGYIVMLGGILRGTKPGFASRCISCGACIDKCPQHIAIPDRLKEVKGSFESGAFLLVKVFVGLFMKFDRWRNMKKVNS